ncbi:thioredoxin family protein [bacterium]|nr:thioredoxin family protein [bacterium]
MRRPLGLLLVLGALCLAAPSRAAEPKVSLALRPTAAAVGARVDLAIEATIAAGWHINAHQPNQKFLVPTTLTLTLPEGVTAGAIDYPAPKSKTFAFAGDMELLVYEGTVPLRAAVQVPGDFRGDAVSIEAVLRFQACDDTTCLPPTNVTRVFSLPLQGVTPAVSGARDVGSTGPLAGAGGGRGAQFASLLADYGIVLTLGAVLLLGLGLNLTPCVYPLISVTIAYFGGQARSRGQTAWLATLYVLGIAASFSALGLAAALSGGIFGAALQQPVVVLFIVGLMIALSLSSFGVYQFQPPTALMRWAGGSASGAAGAIFMGLTMGVVAAPCVGPIVVGLLVFVGSRQDAGLGFLLFFFLALGMGLPYVVLAIAAGSLTSLPRSGEWLAWTEHLFGCILLCLAAYYLAPLLPAPWKHWLLPTAIALSGIYLGFVDRAGRALRGFPALKAAVGVLMIATATWLIRPTDAAQAIAWEPVEQWVAQGRGSERPVLLEFAAEWCIPCREMESTTYAHPDVVREADRFRMVKADITEETPTTTALTSAYAVKGVPTVILFSPRGGEHHRMVGYVGPDEMLAAMRDVH